MATLNDANTLEAHVEKIVLAICALIVIVAAAYWLIGSPRTIEGLPPSQIDQSLAAKARDVQAQVDRATPALPSLPDWPKILTSLQQAPRSEGMVDLAQGNLPLDISGMGQVTIVKPDLAELVALVPPILKTEAVGDFRIPHSPKPRELAGADLQVAFPLSQLQSRWNASKLRYVDLASKTPVVLSVEMEYQEANPGKTWGKPQAFKSDGPPAAGADGKPLTIPALPAYDGKNGEEVAKAVEAISNLAVQKAILHPPYFDVLDPAMQTWAPYKFKLPAPAEGNVAAWAFRDDLSPDKFYRYRMRLHLLNPLYGHPEYLDLKKSKDNPEYVKANAGVPSIATDWSAWSGPVGVPRTTQFFLTGSNPIRGWVKVTVLTRHMGRLVEDNFNVAPGQMIGEPVRVTQGKQTTTIDFGTGAVVIGIDFNKTIYKKGIPTKTVEMIYRSQDNKLKSRLLTVDLREYEDAVPPQPKVAAPAAGGGETPGGAPGKTAPNKGGPGAPAGGGAGGSTWKPS